MTESCFEKVSMDGVVIEQVIRYRLEQLGKSFVFGDGFLAVLGSEKLRNEDLT